MVAASRPDPEDRSPQEEAHPVPADLRELARRYRALPKSSGVRFKVVPGREFLDLLAQSLERHSVKQVAHALGLTTQGVDRISNEVPRLSHPRAWPTQEQLREFRTAWRAVAADIGAGRSIARKDPRYADVHQALADLQKHFLFKDLCAAVGLPGKLLHRFDLPPMPSPGQIARGIERVLPQGRSPSRETLERNNRGWRD